MARARGIVSFRLVPLLVTFLILGFAVGAGIVTLAQIGDVLIALGQFIKSIGEYK